MSTAGAANVAAWKSTGGKPGEGRMKGWFGRGVDGSGIRECGPFRVVCVALQTPADGLERAFTYVLGHCVNSTCKQCRC